MSTRRFSSCFSVTLSCLVCVCPSRGNQFEVSGVDQISFVSENVCVKLLRLQLTCLSMKVTVGVYYAGSRCLWLKCMSHQLPCMHSQVSVQDSSGKVGRHSYVGLGPFACHCATNPLTCGQAGHELKGVSTFHTVTMPQQVALLKTQRVDWT